MSLALIEKFYGHVARGEFAQALQLFADDAEIAFVGPAAIPLSGVYRGRQEIERFFGIVGSSVVVQSFEPQEFIDGGAQLAVIGRERSVVRATGKTFDVAWVQVWTLDNGKIAKLRDYFDTGAMLAAFT